MNERVDKPIFYIEIEPTGGAVRPENAPEKFIEGTRKTLESVAKAVETSCQTFVETIGNLQAKPTELGIEFGVNAAGEAGIPWVTKGSIGANFKITLKWSYK